MLKCDINEVMDEIKGMTIREKNKFLEKFHDELHGFASKVDDLRGTLNDEYRDSIRQQVGESIRSFVTEKHWENMVEFWDELPEFYSFDVLLSRNGSLRAWITLCYPKYYTTSDDEKLWRIILTSNLSLMSNTFPDFVNELGLANQTGDASIEIHAEEDEVFPILKHLISSWCSKEDGNTGNVSDEKDVCDITGKL